jgi:hypothetical protein
MHELGANRIGSKKEISWVASLLAETTIDPYSAWIARAIAPDHWIILLPLSLPFFPPPLVASRADLLAQEY